MSPSGYTAPDTTLLGAEHVRRYQETRGEIGGLWNGVPILLLTTTGRKTGEPRTTPLIYTRSGDDYLIVASRGGAPQHPQWYLNLLAQPEADIQVLAEHLHVSGRPGSAEEQPELWEAVCGPWPNYRTYQQRTDRVIPVVVLTPTTGRTRNRRS